VSPDRADPKLVWSSQRSLKDNKSLDLLDLAKTLAKAHGFVLISARFLAPKGINAGTHVQVLPNRKETFMPKIKLNLSSLSIPQKLAKAQQIVAALTGNAGFSTPSPALATITGATNDLNTAYGEAQAARQTAKEKTNVQNQKEDAFDRLLTQLAAYVESVAGTNEQLILSAGMDMRAAAVAGTDPPGQPQALTPTAGDHDGQIDLSWDPVSGAKSYVIDQSGDPVTPTSWSHGGVSTKSNFTVTGLTSGTRYWFRVAAVNNNGQSGWSDPATKIAP
jgi:Fibronectin type III domain